MSKRSDIFWYPESKINADHILIYTENGSEFSRYQPCEDVLNEIKKAGFQFVSHSTDDPNIIKNFWINRNLFSHDSLERIKKNLSKLVPIDKTEKWLISEIRYLINLINYWFNFFNNYCVKLHYDANESGQEIILKNIALDLLGACSFSKERSAMINDRSLSKSLFLTAS